MSLNEIGRMKSSVCWWSSEIQRRKEAKASRLLIVIGDETDEKTREEETLQYLGFLLHQKETGNWSPQMKRRIEMVKDGRLDWKKFHRLPEAYTQEGLENARIALDKWNAKNPDLA